MPYKKVPHYRGLASLLKVDSDTFRMPIGHGPILEVPDSTIRLPTLNLLFTPPTLGGPREDDTLLHRSIPPSER